MRNMFREDFGTNYTKPAPDHRGRAWMVLLTALVLRVAWGLFVEVHPISDARAYDVTALNIARHGVFGFEVGEPTAFWPPGASFLYAVVYKVFGHGYGPIVVLNAAMGLAVVWLGYELVSRLTTRRVGLWAGLMLAVWPIHIQFTTVLASELAFTAALVGGMLAWVAFEGRTVRRIAFAGVLFAAACYLRPTALLVPPLVAGLDLLRRPDRKRTVIAAAGVGVVMALAIAPWTVRNYRLFGELVPISANSGTNLWMGNNPDATGYYMEYPRHEELGEAGRDDLLGREARAYILREPIAFIGRTAKKFILLHKGQTIGVHWNKDGLARHLSPTSIEWLKYLSSGYWWGVLVLAAVGIFGLCVRDGVWRGLTNPLLVVSGYFAATHAVWVIQDRYTFPYTPLLAGLAGVGVMVVRELLGLEAREAGRE